jgi:hypothetical protein
MLSAKTFKEIQINAVRQHQKPLFFESFRKCTTVQISIKQLLKKLFTVPCEGKREKIETGTFKISAGSLYSYVRYNNGYSETIEVFNGKNDDYIGSFEALYDACSYCERVYGLPVQSPAPVAQETQPPVLALSGHASTV